MSGGQEALQQLLGRNVHGSSTHDFFFRLSTPLIIFPAPRQTPTLAGNLRAVAQDSAIKVSKLAVFMAQLNTLPGCSDGAAGLGGLDLMS